MPAKPKTKVGRPGFDPTPAMRQKVRKLAARGLSKERIAAALGCSVPTFRKHFAEEFLSTFAAEKPKLKKTAALSKRVQRYIAFGMKDLDVARVLGCTVDIFHQLFEEELLTARAKVEAESIDRLWDSAEGNVSAQREVLNRISLTPEKGERPAKIPALGKKQVAEREAAKAPAPDSGWDDLIGPSAEQLN